MMIFASPFSSSTSPLAFGTDRAIVAPGRSQPQLVSRQHPERAVVPGLRLAQERGPKDQRYLGFGLGQLFGETQPQRHVVDRLAGPGIDYQRGDLG